MKKLMLLVPVLLLCGLAFSQSDTLKRLDSLPVFVKVEVESSFPGGQAAWAKYLQSTLNVDKVVKAAAPRKAKYWHQTAYVRFLIDKDGKIVEAVVVNAKELHTAVVEEALRVILGSPKWNPGYQLGKPVRSYRTQPLTFSVSPE